MKEITGSTSLYCNEELIPLYWIKSVDLGIGKVCNRRLEPNGQCLNRSRHAGAPVEAAKRRKR